MEVGKYGNREIGKYGNMEIGKYGNMEIWKYGNMEGTRRDQQFFSIKHIRPLIHNHVPTN